MCVEAVYTRHCFGVGVSTATDEQLSFVLKAEFGAVVQQRGIGQRRSAVLSTEFEGLIAPIADVEGRGEHAGICL